MFSFKAWCTLDLMLPYPHLCSCNTQPALDSSHRLPLQHLNGVSFPPNFTHQSKFCSMLRVGGTRVLPCSSCWPPWAGTGTASLGGAEQTLIFSHRIQMAFLAFPSSRPPQGLLSSLKPGSPAYLSDIHRSTLSQPRLVQQRWRGGNSEKATLAHELEILQWLR